MLFSQADESHYWLEVIKEAEIFTGAEVDRLIIEANELTAIFSATDKTAKEKRKNK